MKFVDHTGNNGFHDRYGRCNGCKGDHKKENGSDYAACCSHGLKDLRQGDKHQTRAGRHTLCPHKGKYGRNDHQTGEQRNNGVENFDLVVGLVEVDVVLDVAAVGDHQVCFFFYVGTIGNHNTHRYTDRKEKLSECVDKDGEKFLQRHSFKIRNEINFHTLQSRTDDTVCIGMGQCQRKNGNSDD